MTTITGHLYNPLGNLVVYGVLHVTLQQDMTSIEGHKVAPFTITVDLSTTGGFVDIDVYPTVGASPAGLAYRVEFDPDPADTSKPMKSKSGYWRNYWAVPDTASVSLGSFVSALRGQPSANYMPVGGTMSAVGDTLTLGAATDTNKRIVANQLTGNDPELRYNESLNRWEFSDDGTTFQAFLQGSGGSVGGDLSGSVGSATVIRIRGAAVSATAPNTTGQYLRWNQATAQYEPSLDGTALSLSASNLTVGTIPLARISGITNTEISATANIAWSKLSFVGSSLGNLATRSASDLSSGTVPLARLSGITNAELSASAAIDATKISAGLVSNTEFDFINGLNQNLGTTHTPQFARVGLGGAADASAVLRIVGQYFSPEVDGGNSGTAKTFNFDLGNEHKVTLNGNCTFTFSNPKTGGRYAILLYQDGTGSRTVTWPSNVRWSGGVAPTLTTTPGQMDLVVFLYISATDRYYGAFQGNYGT